MELLQVEHIQKSFKDNHVLKDISMIVRKGEVVSIIGPSGSGKSTLLRCITMLEHVDGGVIRIGGDVLVEDGVKGPVYAPKKELRRLRLRTGLVFQNFNLFPHFSVLRNLTEAQVRVAKVPLEDAKKTAMELLEKMGIADKADEYPYALSGGQCQRVAIARALAMHPDILFFDEPTSALDPELTMEVLKVIRQLAQEHMTMVIVTHEMAFARDVSDRVIFMDGGVIVADGTPDEVLSRSKNERITSFLGNFQQGGFREERPEENK